MSEPMSNFTPRAQQVLVDGAVAFDMNDPKAQPVTDFDLGIIQHQTIRVQ